MKSKQQQHVSDAHAKTLTIIPASRQILDKVHAFALIHYKETAGLECGVAVGRVEVAEGVLEILRKEEEDVIRQLADSAARWAKLRVELSYLLEAKQVRRLMAVVDEDVK